MADKKKTLKTYKTASGAQQYGDIKAWRNVENKVRKDFLNMTPAEFKEKYGVEAQRAIKKVWAGDDAAKAKEYREMGLKGVANLADRDEKTWVARSKKSEYKEGGMTKKYATGGYANCGASMKATQSSTMMCGGMASKKKK